MILGESSPLLHRDVHGGCFHLRHQLRCGRSLLRVRGSGMGRPDQVRGPRTDTAPEGKPSRPRWTEVTLPVFGAFVLTSRCETAASKVRGQAQAQRRKASNPLMGYSLFGAAFAVWERRRERQDLWRYVVNFVAADGAACRGRRAIPGGTEAPQRLAVPPRPSRAR
jgi:hypothetical protein